VTEIQGAMASLNTSTIIIHYKHEMSSTIAVNS